MREDMAPGERAAWVRLALAVVAYPVYAAIVLVRGAGGPLVDADYGLVLGIGVVAVVVAGALLTWILGGYRGERDERDLLIEKWSDRIGHSVVVLGAVVALALALFEAHHFWIANAIVLGFALSAVLGAVARIYAYRRGFSPTW